MSEKLTLLQNSDDIEYGERVDRAVAIERGVVVISAPRSITIGNRAGFRDHVRQHLHALPAGIVIDCFCAEYIDSSGLGLLFSLAKEAKRLGIGYRVARLAEDLRTLICLTKIDTVVGISDTLRAAILDASIVIEPGELRLPDPVAGEIGNPATTLRLEP